jgi:hypothetical protein
MSEKSAAIPLLLAEAARGPMGLEMCPHGEVLKKLSAVTKASQVDRKCVPVLSTLRRPQTSKVLDRGAARDPAVIVGL